MRITGSLLALSMVLAACGDDEPGPDAGGFITDTGTPDLGMPPVDMGTPPVDMGMPPVDMGMPPVDMGMPPVDMGMPPADLGMPPVDMGMPPVDMGMPPVDMGMPPGDMGTADMGPADVGPADMGANPCMGVDCSRLNDACNVGTCNMMNGMCERTPRPNGTMCSDGNMCTTNDSCQMGTCTSTSTLDCSSLTQGCSVGQCDPMMGCVAQPAMMGTMCDDSNRCTTMDMCDSMGGCVGRVGGCGAGVIFEEDFNASNGGFSAGGNNSSWAWGTPAGTFISEEATGDSEWVTNLSGAYNISENSYIESISFNLGSFSTDPVLEFSQIFQTETCCDEGWVDVSTDGGMTWSRLGNSGDGTNWYNDAANRWWEGVSGGAGVRRTAAVVLSGLAGQSDVRLRFAFSSDGSVVADGFSVDDVRILEGASNDLTVEQVILPPPGCGVVSGSVQALVRNRSSRAIAGFDLAATGLGGMAVTETVTATVPPAGTYLHTFGATINVTTAQTVTVTVTNMGDTNTGNDSASAQASPLPSFRVSSTTPYNEGFESGSGSWTASGQAASWAVGVPTDAFISGAATGSVAAVTSVSANYNNSELSFLTSPCIDLSALTANPILEFQHIYRTEGCCDEGWVETSTNGGVTWNKLGSSGTGNNWYNDSTNDWWDGNSGTSGTWRTASQIMVGTAGVSAFRLRFVMSSDLSVTDDGFGYDDIVIRDANNNDLEVVSVLAPPASCGAVGVELRNNSGAQIDNFTLDVVGLTASQLTETVTNAAIAPGATQVRILSTRQTGSATVTVTANHPGDQVAANNSATASLAAPVASLTTVATASVSVSFEAGPDGFASTGTNSSWAWGRPANTTINGAANGTGAWVTNLSGAYNNNERSSMVSGCYDLTALGRDPTVQFSHIYETEACCDEGWMEVSVDGGLTWTKVAGGSTATNWYNDTTNAWWDGSSGSVWRTASAPLTGTAGRPFVRVRFFFSSDGSVTDDGFGVDDFGLLP